jgi:hypothetical protein
MKQVRYDGALRPDHRVPLTGDGKRHAVQVRLLA